MSLKRIFKFSKPKTPGYGLASSFYLSVLSSHPQLPRLDQVANPKGEGGAVPGFIAPLMAGASKDDLGRPLVRGVYAIASPDRKTVLRMRVVSKEEAGFDPEPLAQSALALTLAPELLARVRATWMLLQLTFESHDPMVTASIGFLFRVAKRLAESTEGVVADPLGRRYLLPAEFPDLADDAPIEAIHHVSATLLDAGERTGAFTLGMQKFGLPEYEVYDFAAGDKNLAAAFLLSLCQARLDGVQMGAGDRSGAKSAPFDLAVGGLDRERWEGIPVLELLPPRGKGISEALQAWRAEQTI